jgi:hypothetical protein
MAYRMTKDDIAALEVFVNDYLTGKLDGTAAINAVSALRSLGGLSIPRKPMKGGDRKWSEAHKAKTSKRMREVWAIYRALESRTA